MNQQLCFSSNDFCNDFCNNLYDVFDLECTGIQELCRTYTNRSDKPYLLRENCFLSLSLPASFCNLVYFDSSWGQEFTKKSRKIADSFSFVNAKGRCSAQSAPFFTLSSEEMHIDFAICTSGNYKVTVAFDETAFDSKTLLLTICDADESFETMVNPGCTYAFPRILAHVYTTASECYRSKQAYQIRRLPSHPVYQTLPVIYNHWWAYEDRRINEDTILANARIAKEIGVDLLVLDAGWFGNDSQDEDWFSVRGDWELVNRSRFPHGLSWLREQVEALGLTFGIWCELEGLGLNARLLKEHPEYAAVCDGKPAGYVCFGSSKVQEWAYETMQRLFSQCGASYWKLDFNLDPGLGCNGTEHEHGPHDGLAKHYEGLYRVLDRLRAEFPDLVIENCSSGGQRFNLEMADHTHVHFLSDPDYSTHQMRIFKEASKWLLPKQLLHFMWSNTVCTDGNAPFENLDLEMLSEEELRYHMRLAMMHQFGISHRLSEYSEHTLSLMKKYLLEYKNLIRPFVANGSYLPLFLSEHTNIFSFCANGQVLLFCFAEKPGTAEYPISEVLDPLSAYTILDVDENYRKSLPVSDERFLQFRAEKDWTCKLMLIQQT